MLLPTVMRKSWIYQMLHFVVSRDISLIENKVTDRQFYWSSDHEFYLRLRISNCKSVWSANRFVRKLMSLRKNESFFKEKQFH